MEVVEKMDGILFTGGSEHLVTKNNRSTKFYEIEEKIVKYAME